LVGKILKIYFANPANREGSLVSQRIEMMSKKKKDKSDDTKRSKGSSSKKPLQEIGAATDRNASLRASELPVTPKPRRAAGVRKKAGPEISADEIALRAYYIAEHRRNLSLPGDEVEDWVEAERQLRKEARRKSP
jgi:hypothetical protein